MKKVLMFAVAGLFVAGLASCKKDHTCTCTISGNTSTTTFSDSKKKDAQDACDALSTSASILGGSCSLD
ncbi:MAG: hypothetical protein GC193_13740 [Cryomorphaceae bacterium]|nr:hypothetical protein [Cryomorphaceae bacterium]